MPEQEKVPVPPENGTSDDATPDAEPKAVEHKPIDAKEEARRRSKADLERKRSRLRGSHGKF